MKVNSTNCHVQQCYQQNVRKTCSDMAMACFKSNKKGVIDATRIPNINKCEPPVPMFYKYVGVLIFPIYLNITELSSKFMGWSSSSNEFHASAEGCVLNRQVIKFKWYLNLNCQYDTACQLKSYFESWFLGLIGVKSHRRASKSHLWAVKCWNNSK